MKLLEQRHVQDLEVNLKNPPHFNNSFLEPTGTRKRKNRTD